MTGLCVQVVARTPPSSSWAPGDAALLGISEADPPAGQYRLFVACWLSGRGAQGDAVEADADEEAAWAAAEALAEAREGKEEGEEQGAQAAIGAGA